MKKNYVLTLLLTLFISGLSFGQVIITELADPNGATAARFVEIYNVSDSDVDLTGWELRRWTNGNAAPQGTGVDLSSIGTLSSGSFALIAVNATEFETVYGIPADINAGTGGAADSNGDDQIAIFDDTDQTIDIFGVPGEDGSGTCHEFEDGRAERVSSVSASSATWNESEWNVWADSTVSGCTSHTNSPRTAPTDYDPGAWIGTASGPSISVGSAVTGLDYFEGSGPSAEGVFQISGINLTADVSVTAPTNFEVSLTSGGTFTSSVTLTQSSGTASGAVYVRLVSGLSPDTYTDNASVTSAGADSQTVSLTGTVTAADPQITVTAFLDNFAYIASEGGPSPEDSFSVEGLFLQDDISITAPANYEVSLTTVTGFGSSVTISPDQAGTVTSTAIFIRLAAGLSAATYDGNITVSSTGVTDELIAVSGNAYGPATNSLIITGVFDAKNGSSPKGVEIYVKNNIDDLSLYGVGSANNGLGTDGQEFTFPAVSATAGEFIYVVGTNQSAQFNTFFGFTPGYESGAMFINGDDAIELFENGVVIDVHGDINVDGTGEPWDTVDSWGYRVNDTGPDGSSFVLANWTFGGSAELDGATNTASTSPFPIGTYSNTPPATGNSVTVATSQAWNAYVNAFNLDNSYAFGFGYTVSDLRATPTTSSMTLEPNIAIWTGEATNADWFDQGAATQTANKYIEASSYIEDNTLAGSDLTFTGNVSVSDLGSGYTVVAFVKALDPNNGYATVVNNTADISSTGDFTASATAAELAAGYIIQYGFAVTGPLADPTDTTLGSVVIGEATAGVEDNSIVNVSVYPNPSNSNWNFRTGNTVITSVEVFNLLGKRVVSQNNNSTEIAISTQGLSSGIYIARITTEQGVKSVKLIRE
ncbi:MAG: lamin tail domain-containing protein [Flavobacteriaceae bacterium]|nr:lamin tail domain-containing protein [Flavobacteriaceae bacterium]